MVDLHILDEWATGLGGGLLGLHLKQIRYKYLLLNSFIELCMKFRGIKCPENVFSPVIFLPGDINTQLFILIRTFNPSSCILIQFM